MTGRGSINDPKDEEIVMKLLTTAALALGFALTVSAGSAKAHVCAHGGHGIHCRHGRFVHRRFVRYYHHHYHHHYHYYRRYAPGVIVPGGPSYVRFYYPSFWGPGFDNPSAPFRNPQQWLMDQEGDVPFTSYRVYPWPPRPY